MRRVFIVAEGGWGEVTPEEYQEQAKIYKRVLENAKDYQGNNAAQVTVIDTVAEAEKRLKIEVDVVIFISRGVEFAAEKIARENPKVKVIVFTGLIPEGKVIWIDKMWPNLEAIRNIVLH